MIWLISILNSGDIQKRNLLWWHENNCIIICHDFDRDNERLPEVVVGGYFLKMLIEILFYSWDSTGGGA